MKIKTFRHIRYIVLAVAVVVTASVAAQRRLYVRMPRIDTTSVTYRYTDSLQSLRQRLDTTVVASESLRMRSYRLFLPSTFYHSPIASRFTINDSESGDVEAVVDSALLNLYMHRPDLVANTEKKLRKAGTIREDLGRKPVKPKVDMTDRIEMLPDETPEVAPTGVVVSKPHFWTYSGDSYLQFLQNYVSDNWYKGGESNYSMVGSLTLKANYNNLKKLKFDNQLELKLGFVTSRDDTLHKFKTNNDLIRYTGKFGLQASKNWYYTIQLLAYTQFTQGLKSNNAKVYSDFMSPFNLNVGLGMDYTIKWFKGKLTGSVNLAPLSFNFRYVGRRNLASSYGISGDHRTLEDFGSQVTSNITWKICEQVTWKSRYYFYTTYKRTEMEWENTFTLAVSRYISANLFVYPRFDDSRDRDEDLNYFQFKEYSSLGFTYNF